MLVNVSSLLTLNPIIVNLALALYGLLFVCIFFYIHMRFRKAGRAMKMLTKDWTIAESTHEKLLETARERIVSLAVAPAGPTPFTAVPSTLTGVTADTRSQVTAMGRRGIPASEIARSCGLPEGEVDVLLGMARMQRMEA